LSSNIKALVFDMDGVLFDSERISRMVWIQAGAEYHLADVEEAERCVIGRSFADTCQFLRERYGPTFPAVEFRTRCSQLFHEYTDAHGMPLMPLAKETLLYLFNKKIPLALASSTRRLVVDKELAEADFTHFFKVTVCGDEVEHSKPNPDIYIEACKKLGFNPEDCIAVEDSPNGIRSAYNAGMKAVMIPDQVQPDEKLKTLLYKCYSSLAELKELF